MKHANKMKEEKMLILSKRHGWKKTTGRSQKKKKTTKKNMKNGIKAALRVTVCLMNRNRNVSLEQQGR